MYSDNTLEEITHCDAYEEASERSARATQKNKKTTTKTQRFGITFDFRTLRRLYASRCENVESSVVLFCYQKTERLCQESVRKRAITMGFVFLFRANTAAVAYIHRKMRPNFSA